MSSQDDTITTFKKLLNACIYNKSRNTTTTETFIFFLEELNDPNIQDAAGNTFLHIIAKKKTLVPYNLFRIVYNININVDILNKNNETVFDIFIKQDYSTELNNIIKDIMMRTNNVSCDTLCKLLSKKYFDATFVAIPKENITDEVEINKLFKLIIDASIIFLEENKNQNENIAASRLNGYIKMAKKIGSKFDFTKCVHDTDKNVYSYIHSIFHEQSPIVSSVIFFISEIMKLPNSIIMSMNCNEYSYYTNISVLRINGIYNNFSYAQKCILDIMKKNMSALLLSHDDCARTVIVACIRENAIDHLNTCLEYIMKNIDIVAAHRINIVNAKDKNGNNMLHYMFAYCVNANQTIIDFYKMIISSKYDHISNMMCEKNASNLTPYNITYYFNYLTFGKYLIGNFIDSYKCMKKETVLHSLIQSSWDGYVGYEIYYEDHALHNSIISKCTKHHYTSSEMMDQLDSFYRIFKKATERVTTTVVRKIKDSQNFVMRPYIYVKKNKKNMFMISKNERFVEIEKLQLFRDMIKIEKEQIGHTEQRDKKGLTYFLTSVRVNTIQYVKVLIDEYIKCNINYQKALLLPDNNNNNVFHVLACNGNEQLFLLIVEQFENIDILSEHFVMSNKDNNTPLDICIEENNFCILKHILDNMSNMDEKLGERLVSKICFNVEYDDQHLNFVKRIVNLSKCRIYNITLRDEDNNNVCSLMNYCAYNEYNSLLKYIVTCCTRDNKMELLKNTDRDGHTVLTVALVTNNEFVAELLGSNNIVASDTEHIKIFELFENYHKMNAFVKLLRFNVLNMNYKYNNITLLHCACNYGNFILVQEMLCKCSNVNEYTHLLKE